MWGSTAGVSKGILGVQITARNCGVKGCYASLGGPGSV